MQRATTARLPIKDPWRVYNVVGGPSLERQRADFLSCARRINEFRPGTLPVGAPAHPPDAAIVGLTAGIGIGRFRVSQFT